MDIVVNFQRKRTPINVELIKYAKAQKIPLDFLSWHTFSLFAEDIKSAVDLYNKALKDNQYTYKPEYIVTEWNSDQIVRGTKYAAALAAEEYFAFVINNISKHTIAAWADFNADENNGYGLMTQNAKQLKPIYYVYKMADDLSRNSSGVATYQDTVRFIISKNATNADTYSIMCWNLVNYEFARAFKDSVDSMEYDNFVKEYGSIVRLVDCIKRGKSIDGKRDHLFAEAKKMYDEDMASSDKKITYSIQFTDAKSVTISNANIVKLKCAKKSVNTTGNTINLNLENNEVVKFDVVLKK